MGQWGVWVIFAIIFAVAEAILPSFFFLWFAIGAGIAAITSLFISSVVLNLLIFLIVSFLLWISTRKIVQNMYKGSSTIKPYQDQFVGMKAKVDKIDDEGRIIVKIKGDEWRAYSEDEETHLTVGDDVIITKKSANFVYIKKIKASENNQKKDIEE
jgi:membrane protein implicated in regulation of membrane protease activity